MKKILTLLIAITLILSSVLSCVAVASVPDPFLMDYCEMVDYYKMQKISPEELRQSKGKLMEQANIYDKYHEGYIEFYIKDSDIPADITDIDELDAALLKKLRDNGIPDLGKVYIDSYDLWNDVGYKMMGGYIVLNNKDKQFTLDTAKMLNDNPFICYAQLNYLWTTDAPEYKIGDVDADGKIDVLDATKIQKYAIKKFNFSDKQKTYGDYNMDGICDIIDAVDIQKFVVAN